MNWVLLLVLLILGYNIIRGYRKGFLRIVYSLVSWVIVLTFVTVATPYINTYLMEHTTLYEKIEQQCSEQIKRSVEEKQRSIQNESSPDNQKLSQFGIMLPDPISSPTFSISVTSAGSHSTSPNCSRVSHLAASCSFSTSSPFTISHQKQSMDR